MSQKPFPRCFAAVAAIAFRSVHSFAGRASFDGTGASLKARVVAERAPPAPEPVRATVLRRRAMTAAWAMLPLTLGVGVVAVLKPLYFGRPWGTPLDCVETFAAGFGTQSALTLVNTLLAQLLAVRAPVRKLP